MLKQNEHQNKYYPFLSMCYITSIIASIIFFKKLIKIGDLLFSASLISYSFTYFFGNAVSEIYGFSSARKLIWSTVICGNAFTLYCHYVLQISGENVAYDNALIQTLGSSLRSSVAGTIAMLAGSQASIYFISKLRKFFLWQGYWTRNIVASIIGETTNTMLVFPIAMFGISSNAILIKTMLSAYLFKIIFVFFQSVPSVLFVYFLKIREFGLVTPKVHSA